MGLFKSELEKKLVKIYTDLFENSMGMSPAEANQNAKEIVQLAVDENKARGLSSYPDNMGQKMMENKDYYDKVVKEGVKDEDIIWWWGLDPLEQAVMVKVDDMNKMVSFISSRENGKEEIEAAREVRKYFPTYGDPDDTTHTKGDDRPLPYELKDRINKYVEHRMMNDPDQYKEQIEKSTTMNALIRNEIKAGRI